VTTIIRKFVKLLYLSQNWVISVNNIVFIAEIRLENFNVIKFVFVIRNSFWLEGNIVTPDCLQEKLVLGWNVYGSYVYVS
jgi:hypothetical protein